MLSCAVLHDFERGVVSALPMQLELSRPGSTVTIISSSTARKIRFFVTAEAAEWSQRRCRNCQEVKSLGNSLLSAMEKGDGEAMAILRAKHERIVMEMVDASAVRPASGGDQVQGRLAPVIGSGGAPLFLLRTATGQEDR